MIWIVVHSQAIDNPLDDGDCGRADEYRNA